MATFVTVPSGIATRWEDTGEMTLPLQSCFSAYIASDVNNITGAGTLFTLGTSTAFTEVFDQNSDFNTNGTFTAPVTGIYLFNVNITMKGLTLLMVSAFARVTTTSRAYNSGYINPFALITAAGLVSLSFSTFADMSVGNTATFSVSVSGGAGDTADISGTASPYNTFISGSLIA